MNWNKKFHIGPWFIDTVGYIGRPYKPRHSAKEVEEYRVRYYPHDTSIKIARIKAYRSMAGGTIGEAKAWIELMFSDRGNGEPIS